MVVCSHFDFLLILLVLDIRLYRLGFKGGLWNWLFNSILMT